MEKSETETEKIKIKYLSKNEDSIDQIEKAH